MSVCDVLERVLDKGVLVAGELTISIADIDLIYLGFCVRLSSVSSALIDTRTEPNPPKAV